jgi:peptidyl-prolyl cis-trans isomerase B (cyclophilin B)
LPAVRRLPASLALLALVALLASGCGGGGGGKSTSSSAKPKAATAAQATTPATTGPSGKAGCQKVAAPKPKPDQHLPQPTLKLDRSKTYTATVDTSCGSFEIALAVKDDPKTTASFDSLASKGFYDDTTFHRIIQGFVIQGGDPQGTGQGGPGYKVVEAPPRGTKYTSGAVAMAKTEIEDPGTSGSQFFVVSGPDAQLPPDYAVLGKVSSGMNVVQTISAVPTGPNDMPLSPVVIRKITVKAT